MTQAPQSASRKPAVAGAVVLAVCCTALEPLGASVGVVSANQHPVVPPDSTPCDPTPSPPFANLLASNFIEASSFHVTDDSLRFDMARCFDNNSKPRLISDDACFPTNAIPQSYIEEICDAVRDDPGIRGKEHYEHYEGSLSDYAQEGAVIDDFLDWPVLARSMANWIRDNTGVVNGQTCVSTLAQNGALSRGTTAPHLNKLYWNTDRITLIGFGFMGALAAGDIRLPIEQYLHPLERRKINLTRIWAVEQWTGLGVLAKAGTQVVEGPTPYLGSLAGVNEYDLYTPNPAFYSRLRRFAQHAADRGIVVQFSLFDKHGIVNSNPNACSMGRWLESPYRDDNNEQNYLAGDPNSCSCGPPCVNVSRPVETEGGTCFPVPLLSFVSPTDEIAANHEAFVQEVAREVGGIGNVLFEIINEAYAGRDWPATGESWQIDIADKLTRALPDVVARDAFNGVANNTQLHNTSADTAQTWTASNTKISSALEDPADQTSLTLGKAVAEGSAPEMEASLPLGSFSPRTGISIRADLVRNVGFLAIGLEDSSGDRGYLKLRSHASAAHEVLWVTEIDENLTESVVGTIPSQGTSNVQLVWDITPTFASASFRIDSGPLTTAFLDWPPFDIDLATGGRALFRGWRSPGTGNYVSTDGSVDNIEATVTCSLGQPSCPAD